MSRRATLPGASELFRLTSGPALEIPPLAERPAAGGDVRTGNGRVRKEPLPQTGPAQRGSGRTRHEAKITVYVSNDELLAMEHARLSLRGAHELIVDRGRLVREAVAVLLADFDQHGEKSVLVQRLRAGGVESQEAES